MLIKTAVKTVPDTSVGKTTAKTALDKSVEKRTVKRLKSNCINCTWLKCWKTTV